MQEHEKRYQFLLEKDGTHPKDLERKGLFYIIAGNEDLYSKQNVIYDFEDQIIMPECLESNEIDFSTSSKRLLELAFSHYNGFPADVGKVLGYLDEDNLKLAIDSMKIRYGLES